MNSNRQAITLILGALGVLIVSALLYTFVGSSGSSGWAANAVHNWEQYGLVTLHGKMVTNPGGIEVLTDPDVYLGHSAVSLFPVFAVGKLLGWLGEGLLMFHLVFSLTLFFAVWLLLGRTHLAMIGACATMLCPGYTIYPTMGDPNAVAFYMMVPFAVVVVHVLSGTRITPLRLGLLAVCVFAYTSLNWSTAFGHGILFCALLVMPSISWSRLGLYVGLAGLSVGVVGGLAVLDKLGGGTASAGSGDFQAILAGYTWGHSGYGVDMTTGKAIVRLGVTNFMGLLPLAVFSGWYFAKTRTSNWRMDGKVCLPLLAAVVGALTMRNYFAQHPWMSVPMVLSGLVMSLALLLGRRVAQPVSDKRATGGWLFLASCFVYALLILGVYRAYRAEALELTSFVRQNTARADIIVLVESLDPKMAAQVETLSEKCDRRLIVLPDLTSPLPVGQNVLVLSATRLQGQLPMVAQSKESMLLSLPLVHELSAWYAQRIARRRAQEQHFNYTAGATFGLYRLATQAH